MTLNYKMQRWTNAKGVLSGQPVHIRRNASLEGHDSRAFPYTVFISLLYRAIGPAGEPGEADELGRLDRTEESIADLLQATLQARFGLVVTGGGTRDLFFFVVTAPSDDELERLIQSVGPEVDYQFERLQDPHWDPYRRYVGETPTSN